MIPKFFEGVGEHPDDPGEFSNHLVRLRKQQHKHASFGVAVVTILFAFASHFIPVDTVALVGRALFSTITGGALMNGLRLHIEIREFD